MPLSVFNQINFSLQCTVVNIGTQCFFRYREWMMIEGSALNKTFYSITLRFGERCGKEDRKIGIAREIISSGYCTINALIISYCYNYIAIGTGLPTVNHGCSQGSPISS